MKQKPTTQTKKSTKGRKPVGSEKRVDLRIQIAPGILQVTRRLASAHGISERDFVESAIKSYSMQIIEARPDLLIDAPLMEERQSPLSALQSLPDEAKSSRSIRA